MRTYRGIVCEKNKDDMVFLTHDGQFLRGIPLVKDVGIGDESDFHLVVASPSRSNKRRAFIIGPALVAAVLLVFLVGSLFREANSAYAYVQIEGENSIELGVDEHGKVVSIRSLEEDMKLEVNDWKGQPLEVVLTNAVKEAAPNNKEIVITTKYENQDYQEVKEHIEKVVKEAQQKNTVEPSIIEESKTKEIIEDDSTNPAIETEKENQKQPPFVEQKLEEKRMEKSSNNEPAEIPENNTKPSEKTAEIQDNSMKQPIEKSTLSTEKSASENEHSNKNNENKNGKSEDDKMRGNSSTSQNKNENSTQNNKNNQNLNKESMNNSKEQAS